MSRFVAALAAVAAMLFASTSSIARPALMRLTGAAPRLTIGRLDQSSRYAQIGNIRPGGRVELYSNGYLIAYGYPRGTSLRLPFRVALRPGSQVFVVERFGNGAMYGRAFTTVQTNYVTYHFDNGRTGWNPYEQTLTVKNVATSQFGKLFNLDLDADSLSQPLYVGGLSMGALGVHNVIYAATENDSVFAFDADTGAPLWATSFVNPAMGITAVPIADIGNCKNIAPTVGITSTPVIDATTNTMYVVAKIEAVVGGIKSWHQMLHAIDITTGLDLPGSPVEITGSVTVGGGGQITFNPRWQLNRIALLESGGVVYVGFGSHCDFHGVQARGWIFGYAADTLAQVAQFVSTVDSQEGFGSFWQAGFGLSTDDQGAIYAVSGNGAFDGVANFGNSVLKLRPDLSVMDFFTPYDYQQLDQGDQDLGSGGAMVLPELTGQFPDLVLVAGKSRTLYMLNRDDLGGLTLGGPDRVVQSLPGTVGTAHGLWGGPAYYVAPNGQPYVYFCGGQDHLKAFALSLSPLTQLVLASQTRRTFGGEGGTTPVVSSNGAVSGTGILWAINRSSRQDMTIRLMAYNALDMTRQLVSMPAGTYDNPNGGYFGVPTVINGKVYVGTGRSIAVFGLH